jgi:hypothetical protein
MKDTLTPFLERFKKNLEEQAKEAMEMSLSHAVKLAKENHKYKDQSGGLTDSTVSRPVEKEGMVLVGEIANTSRLALFIHEGTGLYGPEDKADKKPYPIVPKDKKALSFEIPGEGGESEGSGEEGSGEDTGKVVTVKKVMHPGIKPDPFLLRALHETHPWFLKKLQGAFNKAIRMSVKK